MRGDAVVRGGGGKRGDFGGRRRLGGFVGGAQRGGEGAVGDLGVDEDGGRPACGLGSVLVWGERKWEKGGSYV